MIEIKNLCYHSRTRMLINDISVTFHNGEIIGLVGPSGSGKSRFLRCIAGLETFVSGTIDTHGQSIGMVFQNFNLFQHLTAVENVVCGMIHVKHEDPEKALEKALKLLDDVGMAEKAYSITDGLSGGQKQRIAIARTLSTDPDIILFDEPTSNLDPMMVGEVEAVIRDVAKSGKTIIIVSHEMDFLKEICTRICFITDGKIIEDGTPQQVIDNPSDKRVSDYIRGLSILQEKIDSRKNDILSLFTRINQYGSRYAIAPELIEKLKAVIEEFLQLIIIRTEEDHTLSFSARYDKKESCIHTEFHYDNYAENKEDILAKASWAIIRMNAAEMSQEKTENWQNTTILIK